MNAVRVTAVKLPGLAMCLLVGGTPALATVYTVMPDGSGDFPTIQAAVVAASDTDIIQLADGVFSGDGNRDIDYLGKAIAIESVSGDPAACTIQGSTGHRGFVFQSGEGPSSVLAGITVGGADHPFGGDGVRLGGGILCVTSSPTLMNLVISGRVASAGGGLHCVAGAPSLTEVDFVSCASDSIGGGMCCLGGSPSLTDVSFHMCRARGLTYDPRGGGLYCADSSPELTDVTFSMNRAWAYCIGQLAEGGGLYCSGGAPILTGVTFSHNVASGEWYSYIGTYGGGMCCAGGSPTLTEVVFERNDATADIGGGGGMSCQGATAVLSDVIFSGNGAVSGGGLESSYGHCLLTNVRFTGNRTDGMKVDGSAGLVGVTFWGNDGGICVEGRNASLTNVTLAHNTDFGIRCLEYTWIDVANTVIAFTSDGPAVCGAQAYVCSLDLTCCNVFGNAGGDYAGCLAGQCGVDGNISKYPLFCVVENPEAPWTLHDNSPCMPYSPPNPGCDLIGAWGAGCGPSAVEEVSWGSIKALFR